MSVAAARANLITRLRDDIAACERTPTDRERSATPTGWPALDRLLPLGGVRRGALIELARRRSRQWGRHRRRRADPRRLSESRA